MPFLDTDAFATIAEVEARWARGAFSTLTVPTAQAVLDWKAMRAVPLQGMIAAAGYPYTVYSGSNSITNGIADPYVKGLETLLKMVNAIGTILDIESALEGLDTDSAIVRSEFWSDQFDVAMKLLENYLKTETTIPAMSSAGASEITWSLSTEW